MSFHHPCPAGCHRSRPLLPLLLSVASLLLLFTSSPLHAAQILHFTPSHTAPGGVSYQRSYYLYLPSAYTPGTNLPLVFNISPNTASYQMSGSGMNAIAERERFIIAYPEPYNLWFGPDRSDPYDDLGFIDDVLAQVTAGYSVDPARVYATGFSAGGTMAYCLSVHRPYAFGAIAAVGGDRPYAQGTTTYAPLNLPATPARPFPLLHMHGTADPAVPYNGGLSRGWDWPPVPQVVGDYVSNNHADTTPSVYDFPDSNMVDYSTVQRLTYANGDPYLDAAGTPRASEVLFYRVLGGGHSWPGDYTGWPSGNLPVNRDINASEEIWSFFSRHAVAVPEPSLSLSWLLVPLLVPRRHGRTPPRAPAAWCIRPPGGITLTPSRQQPSIPPLLFALCVLFGPDCLHL